MSTVRQSMNFYIMITVKSDGFHIWLCAMWLSWVTAGNGPRLWTMCWTRIMQRRAQRNREEMFKLNEGRPCQGLAYKLHEAPWLHPHIRSMRHASFSTWEDLNLQAYCYVNQWLDSWEFDISAACHKSCLCSCEKRGLWSATPDGFSFAYGRSVMTEGRRTHLKVGHSQLRQTIHVWTQDFVFPNFQGLSAPSKREREQYDE